MGNKSSIKRIAAAAAAVMMVISGLPAPMARAQESISGQNVTSTNLECVTDGQAAAERQDNGYYTISAVDGFSQASLVEKMDIRNERLRMKISLEASDYGNDMKAGYFGFSSAEPWNVSNMNFAFLNDNAAGNMMFKIWHNTWNDILTICLMNQTETGVDWPAILNVWNFDWEAEHTFGLVKENENWYLEVDGQKSFQQDNEKMDACLQQKFNELCEDYARNGAYIRVGSEGSKVVFSQLRKGSEVDVTVQARALSTTGGEVPADLKGGGRIIGQAMVEAPQQDPSGWVFKGWYKDSWKGKLMNTQRTYRFDAAEDISLVAVYEAVEQVVVRVEDSGAAQSSQMLSKKFGEQVTISAQGAGFINWTNAVGAIVSHSKEYTFTAVSNDTLTANYEGQVVVVWESESGQVIKRSVYNGAVVAQQDMPLVPERLGYKAAGWKLNAADINALVQQGKTFITNRPVYTMNDNVYQITVEGGSLNCADGRYRQNEVVTATADKALEGRKFSHWADQNGDVLSYQQKYKFYAISDFYLTAVYIGERDTVKSEAAARIVKIERNEENTNTSFAAQFSVPEGCQMEFAGMVATQDAGKGIDLNKDNADYVRGRRVDTSYFQYTWTKTTGADEDWFVRPYLVYRDKQGNVNEIYGDLQREQMVVVLTPEKYGAKADGVTDDLLAIRAAVQDARNYWNNMGSAVEIRFQEDAVYYVSDNVSAPNYGLEPTSALDLRGLRDVTLKGNNTTIRMDMDRGLDGFANIDDCENIQIEGFNLKTSKSVYAIGTVKGVNTDWLYIDIESDRDLEISGVYDIYQNGSGFSDVFGLPLTDYNRAHMFIDKMHEINSENEKTHEYRIFLLDKDDIRAKLNSMPQKDWKFLLPRPDWGQKAAAGPGAFIVNSTKNIRLENINMWSASSFCFHMRHNEGTILIRNVNITPEPGTDEAMSGWRDGFHLKENRGKFIFENCTIEKNHDDAFNTGTTHLEIEELVSDREIVLYCSEYNGPYYGNVMPGDRLMIYDEDDGTFAAYGTVKEVRQESEDTRIILNEPVNGMKKGYAVSILALGQPDMVVKNCYIRGTYRFRTPLTCEDTVFDTMYAWFDNLPDLEGPVASDQHFVNCAFRPVKAPEPEISFGGSEYMMEIGSVVAPYHTNQGVLKADNIVFENCMIDPKLIRWKGGYDVWVNGVRYVN